MQKLSFKKFEGLRQPGAIKVHRKAASGIAGLDV
jgi:hypothetical protein